MKTLSQTVTTLKAEVKAKDDCIRALQDNVEELQTKLDDLEQQGRKDSVRIFGLPEVDPGTTDEKVIKLCNEWMKLEPPLALEEIAVSHRLGLQKTPEDAAVVPPPRPLLVKFVSRRSKQRVMEVRKNLRVPKNTGIMQVDDSQATSSSEIQAGDLQPHGWSLYLDLIKWSLSENCFNILKCMSIGHLQMPFRSISPGPLQMHYWLNTLFIRE